MSTPFSEKNRIQLPNLIHEISTFQFDRSIDTFGADDSGGGNIQFPFQLQNHSTGVAGGALVNPRYGTVMDVEPTNCETDISLADSTTTIIYIHVVVDINGAFVSGEILTGASQPADGSYDGYITIGSAVTGVGFISALNQAMTHSLRMAMCGRVVTGGVLTAPGTFEFWGF